MDSLRSSYTDSLRSSYTDSLRSSYTVDNDFIVNTICRVFTELGFEGGKHDTRRHYSFTKSSEEGEEDGGSVFYDSLSVTYYINGFVDFISPISWNEDSEEEIRDNIVLHLRENRQALIEKEMAQRSRALYGRRWR